MIDWPHLNIKKHTYVCVFVCIYVIYVPMCVCVSNTQLSSQITYNSVLLLS